MRRISDSIGRKLFVSAVLVALCSSSGAQAGTVSRGHVTSRATGPSWMHKIDAATSLTYVSDASGFVDIFSQDGILQGQLTGFSQLGGIYVDKAHNLWVTDTGAAQIYAFPRGSTQPSIVLSDPVGAPDDVTICPNGTVYVSNLSSSSPPSGANGNRWNTAPPPAARGSIEVYPHGAISPTRYLQFADQLYNLFVTCDANGNVFTTLFYGPSTSAVVEYAHGKGIGTLLPISLLYVGAVKADSAGNILVGDQAGHSITEYTEAGSPTGLSISTGSGDIQQFALTRSGTVLGAADSRNKDAVSWTFPGGGSATTYSDPNFQYPTGFAYDPPARR